MLDLLFQKQVNGKRLTYEFHYKFIKKGFDAELLLTDTDSLIYEIKSENVYEKFFKWKDLFDLSNFSKDSKFFDEANKKIIGKTKDKFGYNTAKGVSIATEFNKFKDVLFNKKVLRHKMKRIQSKKHKLGTYEIDEISLSFFDDKRYVLVIG